MRILTVLLVICFFFFGCTSTPAKQSTEAAGQPVEERDLTEEYIFEEYSAFQLNAAVNLLRVVKDVAPKSGREEMIRDSLGCSITIAQTKAWLPVLKSLISKKVAEERDVYSAMPEEYARREGFDSCSSSCSCDLLAAVIKDVNTKSFSPRAMRVHERYAVRLKTKADLQGPIESLNCAVKQKWFCRSDLKKFLEQQTRLDVEEETFQGEISSREARDTDRLPAEESADFETEASQAE